MTPTTESPDPAETRVGQIPTRPASEPPPRPTGPGFGFEDLFGAGSEGVS